jgi:hypothetical protein
MATRNFFALLGDDDFNEDPAASIARAEAASLPPALGKDLKKKQPTPPAAAAAAASPAPAPAPPPAAPVPAKLPTKPLPPSQAGEFCTKTHAALSFLPFPFSFVSCFF